MTPLALAALEREKERQRQAQRRARERREAAEERARQAEAAAKERRRLAAIERNRQAAAAAERRATAERRAAERRAAAPFAETVALNIYARRTAAGIRYAVIIDGQCMTFDDLEEARDWRNRFAGSRRESRPYLFVNLIRAGEAPGRL
jgi:hypothetical protein